MPTPTLVNEKTPQERGFPTEADARTRTGDPFITSERARSAESLKARSEREVHRLTDPSRPPVGQRECPQDAPTKPAAVHTGGGR